MGGALENALERSCNGIYLCSIMDVLEGGIPAEIPDPLDAPPSSNGARGIVCIGVFGFKSKDFGPEEEELECILQDRLLRRVSLLIQNFVIPNPFSLFGLVMVSHLTICIFFLESMDPQIKFLWDQSSSF